MTRLGSIALLLTALVLTGACFYLWWGVYTTSQGRAISNQRHIAALCDDLRFIARTLAESNRTVSIVQAGHGARPMDVAAARARKIEYQAFANRKFESCLTNSESVPRSRIHVEGVGK